jgi:hypothetical protein
MFSSEHDKHETTPNTSGVGSAGYGSSDVASSTTPSNTQYDSTNVGSSATPATTSTGAKDTTEHPHHYGRDAGIGAGAVGAGALAKQ